MTDWYRELTRRLLAAPAGATEEERARIYAECRASAPPGEAERLEVAIRRVEQQALLDTLSPPRPRSSPPVSSEAKAPPPRALWWAPWIRPD